MKVLSFTTLWPNKMQPFHGLFVRERMKAVAKHCELKVIAPVPWFLPTKLLGEQYYRYTQVPAYEKQGELDVFHPRFLVLPKIGKFLDGWLMYVSLRRFLQRFLHDFAYNLIDAHYGYPDGYAAACLAKKTGVPYTITVRGTDMTLFAHEKFRGKLVRKGLEDAAKVICVSRSLQEEVLAIGIPPERTVVLENGVDPQKFYPIPQVNARDHLGLPPNAKIILSVGHLREGKGFHLLIEVVKDIQSFFQNSPVLLVIVGGKFHWDSSYQQQLVQQINEKGVHDLVSLVGAKPPDDLRYWYSAADVFCLASSREGCPNVVLESLACGTPVVATGVSGIPDILSVPYVGIQVERSVQSLRQGIVQALGSSWNNNKIAQYARDNYSWKTTAEKVYSIFQEALRNYKNKE